MDVALEQTWCHQSSRAQGPSTASYTGWKSQNQRPKGHGELYFRLQPIERLLRIIPESPELRNAKVISARPPVRIKALTALQLIVPHIGRHLEQAERILKGGRLLKESQENNPDLIYPTKDA